MIKNADTSENKPPTGYFFFSLSFMAKLFVNEFCGKGASPHNYLEPGASRDGRAVLSGAQRSPSCPAGTPPTPSPPCTVGHSHSPATTPTLPELLTYLVLTITSRDGDSWRLCSTQDYPHFLFLGSLGGHAAGERRTQAWQ